MPTAAAAFRSLPDAEASWKDVCLAALTRAALFAQRRGAIGWYLCNDGAAAAHCIAGAVIAVLPWVCCFFFVFPLGAELACQVADHRADLGRGA